MLKAPPLNHRDYKSRTSKIIPGEGRLNVRKNVRYESGLIPVNMWEHIFTLLVLLASFTSPAKIYPLIVYT